MAAKVVSKNQTITVRLSGEDYQLVAEKAQEIGKKASTYMRMCALERAQIAPFIDDDDAYILSVLFEDLRKIGVNLNQLARAMNSGRHPSKDEISISIQGVDEIVNYMMAQFNKMLDKSSRVNVVQGDV